MYSNKVIFDNHKKPNNCAMRTTKQLLELMLQNKNLFLNGLCCWAVNLHASCIISNIEYDKLRMYIERNRPSKYSSVDAYIHSNSVYYWKMNKIEPRIKWIKKQIKKLS